MADAGTGGKTQRQVSPPATSVRPDADDSPPPPTLDQVRAAATRIAIQHALQRNRGRLIDTARELGISRVTLYRLLGRHGLREGHPAAAKQPARIA